MGMEPAQEIAELRAEVADLEERVSALEGAVNAFIVVYGVRRLPPPEPGEASSGG